jgi:hypothetical protein
MRQKLLLMLFSACLLAFSTHAFGQKKKRKDALIMAIEPAKNKDSLSRFDDAEGITLNPVRSPAQNMYSCQHCAVRKKTFFIVRFHDSTGVLTIGKVDTGISISVKVNGVSYPVPKVSHPFRETDINIDFDSLLGSTVVPAYSQVVITATLKVDTTKYYFENDEANFVYTNKFQPYQTFGQNIAGFWLPALVYYSTNFKPSAQGIPFAALPIGLAWGYKWYHKSGGYTGLSAMGNLMFYTPPTNVTSSSGTNSNPPSSSFTLQGFTIGALLDINDWVSVGYVYGKSFQTGVPDAGNMFVIALGSNLLSLFKLSKPATTSSSSN